MSKILAVFGATGKQGGSVVTNVLKDAELSQEYKIRAITRDVKSDKASQLSKDVEVVTGDTADVSSLETALAGVHTVFAMTEPAFGPDAAQLEYSKGKAIADAAVKQGVKYIIFSTLPSVKEISGGKYTSVTNFDAKALIEIYIRGLPIKSAFFLPGEFMENFHNFPFYPPQRQADDTWVIARPNAPTSKSPFINAVEDAGKFVGAILADPDKWAGKTILGATKYHTLTELAEIFSKHTGKTVVYKQISVDEFRASLPDFIATIFTDVIAFNEEYGYFGPDGEQALASDVKQVRGKLHTLEEFLAAHPVKLE